MPLQLENLLDRGYFPKELPPPFTTSKFAQAVAGVSDSVPPDTFSSSPKFSIMCTHNLVRTGGFRRNLGIPNPKHYYRLCKVIISQWNELENFASNSPFSLTKPIDGQHDRAISPEHDLSERTISRAQIRSSARFILQADISRFFPSIYTHSIPWALLGKIAAKQKHLSGTLSGTWQDSLDVMSRSINNNQTIGLPIGPDTSRLIAEILLSRIDQELSTRIKHLNGIRFIDDYEFGFPTRSQAEDTLNHLQHLLNEYELALNPSKTKIIELPVFLDPVWTSKIRIFRFRKSTITGQKSDIAAYFDMVFDFFKRYPEEGLLKYAIGRLRSVEIFQDNWTILENILCHCVMIEPACIQQVCDQVVYYYKSKKFKMNKPLWISVLNSIVFERVPWGQSSEAAWAMWLMKILKVRLYSKCAKVVGNTEDSIVGLMALFLAHSGLASKTKLSNLNRFSSSKLLFENQWLLCYQGNIMDWFGTSGSRRNLQSDPLFSYLESRDVSFLDISVSPPAPVRYTSKLPYSGGGGGGGGVY